MPAYNAEKYIQDSIDSVLNQSYRDWELIIVDDGSSDSTAEIAKQNVTLDSRITFVHQQNKKQGAARNTGLKIAKGDWIAFLDSDDLWRPEKLAIQMQEEFAADVIYTTGIYYYETTENSEPYIIKNGFSTAQEMYKLLFIGNPIPNLSVVMKKKMISLAGYQNESLEVNCSEDWEYWLRLAKAGASFYGINKDLFVYRVHDAGSSRNQLKMQTGELYAKYLNFDPVAFDTDFLHQHVVEKTEKLIAFYFFKKDKLSAFKLLGILNSMVPSVKYKLTKTLSFIPLSVHYFAYILQPHLFFEMVKRKLGLLK